MWFPRVEARHAHQQEENIKKYLNGDLMAEFLNMLRHLHAAGMNYDMTNLESSDRALQPCRHWWLSDDVISILKELDTLGKQANALRLVSKRGNWPLPGTKDIKLVYDSTKTTCLPKNWYHCEWYKSLSPCEQGDLNCADLKTLHSILGHLNFPENFPAISDQYLAWSPCCNPILSGGSSCT